MNNRWTLKGCAFAANGESAMTRAININHMFEPAFPVR